AKPPPRNLYAATLTSPMSPPTSRRWRRCRCRSPPAETAMAPLIHAACLGALLVAGAPPTSPGTESIQADAKRPVPNYDGRAPAPPTAREGFIWIPRVLLFPVQATVEYGVRRPVRALLRWG